MSELDLIRSTLDQARSRRRLSRALNGLWRGLWIGSLVCLLGAVVYHLFPLPDWFMLVCAGVPVLGALVGFVAGGWRQPDIHETARWIDLHQGLKERLSTALELAGGENPWSELVVRDAASHAREVDSRRLVAFALPFGGRWALLVLAVVAGLGFVPEYRPASLLTQEQQKQTIQATAKTLEDLTRRRLENRPPALETVEKSMESVLQVAERLQTVSVNRAEALKELASVSEQLQKDLENLRKDETFKRLEEAARGSEPGTQNRESLQERMDALRQQLGNAGDNPAALDKMQQKLSDLHQAMKGANDRGGMSDSEKQAAQAALAALAQQAEAMGLNLPGLEDALRALEAENPGLFLKELEEALYDLEKTKQLAQTLQQLQQQYDELGKDLAEQLQRGQPDAAVSTLKKMMAKLASDTVTPEELKQILEEVRKAVNPAGQYGDVDKHLKRACEELGNSDKPSAGQSLAAAAKELEDLMQQLADAQDLQSAMENLRIASMCIGTQQGWGACRGAGNRPGNKPGSGVGTWANDDNWMSQVENTGLWDNSGILRPDQDPRGLTDRGEGEISDALNPTKVKGQFSPGGQMPSITLKGVSIRGQSRVAFEEAAAAAQVDAQSALNQEKVPRVYQGTVRDYFYEMER